MVRIKISYARDIPKDFTGRVDWAEGHYSYHVNGKYHRIDGPAVMISSIFGREFDWYLEDISYSKEEWFNLLTPEQKIKALFNEENW